MSIKDRAFEGLEKGVALTEGKYKIRPYSKKQHKTVGAILVVARFSTPSRLPKVAARIAACSPVRNALSLTPRCATGDLWKA